MHRQAYPSKNDRRGAVAVEFAVLAPVLLVLALGFIEIGRAFEVQQIMVAAAREGARFGSMDKEGIVSPGSSSLAKIEEDIRNFLTAAGVPGDEVSIDVYEMDNPGTPFDFDDPDNNFKLFQVDLDLPFSEVTILPPWFFSGYTMHAQVVFRNARASLSG